MQSCLQCGSVTANPRFCGRSCAAIFNNRVNPKRKPEGKCRACNAPTPTSKNYCSACQNDPVQRAKSLEPVVVPVPIPEVIYDLSASFGDGGFGRRSRCGDLLDYLANAFAKGVEYLHLDDAHRTQTLLSSLGRFQPKGQRKPVRDRKLVELGQCTEEWLSRFVSGVNGNPPIVAIYALGLAVVLQKHIRGCWYSDVTERLNWNLRSVILTSNFRTQVEEGFSFLEDRLFKKDFTETVGKLIVRVKVPLGFKVEGSEKYGFDASLLSPFDFYMERCPISDDWYHFEELKIVSPEGLGPDIFATYQLKGGAFYSPPKNGAYSLIRGSVPLRWVTHFRVNEIHSKVLPVPIEFLSALS